MLVKEEIRSKLNLEVRELKKDYKYLVNSWWWRYVYDPRGQVDDEARLDYNNSSCAQVSE